MDLRFPIHEIENAQNSPSLIHSFFLTGISASTAELVAYPFDVTKTRLHIQGESAEAAKGTIGGTKPEKRGMVGIALGIAREEGITRLYSGLSCMVLRCFVFNSVRLVTYDMCRQRAYTIKDGKEHLSLMGSVVCSISSGGISQLIANPLDIVKIQMQTESRRLFLGKPPRIKGIAHGLYTTYKKAGIQGLWRGITPSVLRAKMLTVGDVGAYDISKRRIMSYTGWPDGRLVQFFASFSAGFFGSVLSTPLDVVKSRIMNQPLDEHGRGLHYKNTADCFIKLVTQEGVLAMYKGFLPCWLRVGPWSVVFWVTFEQVRNLMGQTGF